jgi:threonyl-tRNA synthetase
VSLDISVAGELRSVPEGTGAGDLFEGDRQVVVARVNGQLRDLEYRLQSGDEVEPVSVVDPEGLAVLRHSTAHVMAQAVQDLFPDARLGIGPPVKDGFYYDFSVPAPFHPDDLVRSRSLRAARVFTAGLSPTLRRTGNSLGSPSRSS